MSLIQEPAHYRGVVVEHAVSATKEKGLPQFVAKFRALEKYDSEEKVWVDWSSNEDSEITAYLVLISSKGEPIFHAKDVQKVFEWDGASLVGLETLDLEGAEVQFEVVAHTYEGDTKNQVANIRGYNEEPGGSVKKLDGGELAALNAKFGSSLKKLSGGPKIAKAPSKSATSKAAAKKGKDVKAFEEVKAKVAAENAARAKKAAPPPPAAPTEEEATTEAGIGTDIPVDEAIEEFKGKTTAPPPLPPNAPPKAPPAPPTKESADDTPVDALTMTYEEAWKECYAKKAKTVDDKMIAAAFSAAMHRQAPGASETEISGEDWALIAEAVVGECG